MTIETSYPETTIDPPLPVPPLSRDRSMARWVSRVASPPLLAVTGVLVAAVEATGVAAWWWAAFLLTLSVGVPSGFVFYLVKRGKVTDFDVFVRSQRFWPYILSLVCGGLSWLVLAMGHAPRLMIVLSGASVSQGLLMFLINTRWKISAHAASTAGIAVIIWQILGTPAAPVLLVIPLVAWSRVRLGRHTLLQVVAGAALGAAVFLTALVFWI
jgi:membrane-associated phospholipid phosphatase